MTSGPASTFIRSSSRAWSDGAVSGGPRPISRPWSVIRDRKSPPAFGSAGRSMAPHPGRLSRARRSGMSPEPQPVPQATRQRSLVHGLRALCATARVARRRRPVRPARAEPAARLLRARASPRVCRSAARCSVSTRCIPCSRAACSIGSGTPAAPSSPSTAGSIPSAARTNGCRARFISCMRRARPCCASVSPTSLCRSRCWRNCASAA